MSGEELTVSEFCQQINFMRCPHIIYIQDNIDKLDHKQQQTLMRYIAKHCTSCLKECADGTRINLDTIDVGLLKKIEYFIRNQVEYNSFFICSVLGMAAKCQ